MAPFRLRKKRIAPGWLLIVLSDRASVFAGAVLLAMGIMAAFPDLVAPHDPYQQALTLRNMPPLTVDPGDGRLYLLGTDFLGRDLLSRIVLGARTSLLVAVVGVGLSLLIGSMLGLVAGYRGGRTESILMRLVDFQMSFPVLALALYILFVLGAGLLNLIIVIVLARWPIYARVARSIVLDIKEQEFVESARSIGVGQRRLLFVHIVPNVLAPITVLATLESARVIIAEASLSFLGMGVLPPDTSWGLILAEGRAYLTSAWWTVTFSGLTIFMAALSWNLLAGTIRVLTDPLERHRRLSQRRRAR